MRCYLQFVHFNTYIVETSKWNYNYRNTVTKHRNNYKKRNKMEREMFNGLITYFYVHS